MTREPWCDRSWAVPTTVALAAALVVVGDEAVRAVTRESLAESAVNASQIEFVADQRHPAWWCVAASVVSEGAVVDGRVRLMECVGDSPAFDGHGWQTIDLVHARLALKQSAVGKWPPGRFANAILNSITTSDWTSGWARLRLPCAAGMVTASEWPEVGSSELQGSWQVCSAVDTASVTDLAGGGSLPPEGGSRAKVWADDLRARSRAAADPVNVRRTSEIAMRWPPPGPGPLVIQTSSCVILASGDLAAAMDARSGRWLRLTHRNNGLELLNPHRREPLFRLTWVERPGGPAHTISATDFRRVEWRQPKTNTIEAIFGDGPSNVVSASVRFEVLDQEGMLIWFETKCPSAIVTRVECPILSIAPALGGDASDDRLLIPHSHTDGILVHEPAAQDRRLGGQHPGDAAVQMMAVYDRAGGLLTATRDTRGEIKELSAVARAGRFLTLTWAHHRPQMRGDSQVPYPVWLAAFQGDWRDAADLYKRWARRQFWCARPLTARDDIPKFLKNGASGVIYSIANEQGYNNVFGPNLERLPEIAREWRERLRVPHVFIVPYGWERRGMWAGINYFPAIPSDEAWIEVNRQLAAEGNATAFLTSGFWWVVRRPTSRNGPSFDDTADLQRHRTMVIAAADGSPWFVDNYGKAEADGGWRGWAVALCHGCTAARGTIQEIFLRVSALGGSLISFDQEIGGRQAAPCFSSQHGHPPGWGAWMWSDFTNLCGGILRAANADGRRVGLLTENCGEMIIPVMATFWSRQFGVADHATPGDETVGLFSYLYHEYVTAIAAAMVQGQGPRTAVPSPGLRAQAMAHALVRGLLPCPFATLVPMDPTPERRPPMSQAYLGFARAFAKFPEFLVLGETLRPPPVTCEHRQEYYTLRDSRPDRSTRRVWLQLPNVVAGRFRAPNGAIATVLANPTEREQAVECEPHEVGRPARLCDADGQLLSEWKQLPPRCAVTLPPYSCRLIVVPSNSTGR